MSIKQRIKIKNNTEKSVFKDKTVSDDYKSGGAYKAIIEMFANQLDDDKFAEHCKKFFKGDKDGPTDSKDIQNKMYYEKMQRKTQMGITSQNVL